MTLAQLLTILYQRFDYTGTPVSSAVTVRLTASINHAHRAILTAPGISRLRDDVMPITAYNGIARTGLPQNVSRVNAITDRTNNLKLQQVPLSELRLIDPGRTFIGGYPMRYSIVTECPVYRQPGAASPTAAGYGLWAASTAAGDTTQKVFVESVTVGGNRLSEGTAGVALTGVTPVQVSARTDNIEVTKFYLDTAAVGFVSLFDANGGNELAKLPIGQTFSRYLAVEWSPIQQADTTEYVDYTRKIADLVNTFDEPQLPGDFHELVILGASLREMSQIDTRYPALKQDYATMLTALENWIMNDGDRIASLRPTRQPWSMLGGNYPADRWSY